MDDLLPGDKLEIEVNKFLLVQGRVYTELEKTWKNPGKKPATHNDANNEIAVAIVA